MASNSSKSDPKPSRNLKLAWFNKVIHDRSKLGHHYPARPPRMSKNNPSTTSHPKEEKVSLPVWREIPASLWFRLDERNLSSLNGVSLLGIFCLFGEVLMNDRVWSEWSEVKCEWGVKCTIKCIRMHRTGHESLGLRTTDLRRCIPHERRRQFRSSGIVGSLQHTLLQVWFHSFSTFPLNCICEILLRCVWVLGVLCRSFCAQSGGHAVFAKVGVVGICFFLSSRFCVGVKWYGINCFRIERVLWCFRAPVILGYCRNVQAAYYSRTLQCLPILSV